MQALTDWLNTISGVVWGKYLLIPLLALTGVYLTVGLRAMPWRRIALAFRLLFSGRKSSQGQGDISPFQSLMTALSATIGTGNIAGVATAIYFGGPGAVFWMWMIALFGMATKYAEAVLAVHYREQDSRGMTVGGPMYYIRNGLGAGWAWMGVAFAAFGMIAAFGIGNMVQSNSVADVLHENFAVPSWLTGTVLAALAAAVIIGGIRRLAAVAAKLVPLMALLYIGGALVILILHAGAVPGAFAMIFEHAFNGTAATGGFAGASVWLALQYGFARGIFSNEAGLGSAPIAHAAAQTNDPVRQGLIAMLGTFIDTLVVCTMTALVILVTGAWDDGLNGARMSLQAFSTGISGGEHIVTFGLMIFAFTTVLGWSYYGERCAEFLFGTGVILPYRALWVVALFFGAIWELKLVWVFADVMNGLMALPNLIALLLLSPVLFRLSRGWRGD